MFFNSLHYVIFLPIVVAFYFLIPPRRRWIFLLAASYYFYMCWKMEYIVLILASTIVDYYAGLHMGRIKDKSKRRKFLVLSLISNLGLLFAFKYFNFFNESTRAAFAHIDSQIGDSIIRAVWNREFNHVRIYGNPTVETGSTSLSSPVRDLKYSSTGP